MPAEICAAHSHHEIIRVEITGRGDELPPGANRNLFVLNRRVKSLRVLGPLGQAIVDRRGNPFGVKEG